MKDSPLPRRLLAALFAAALLIGPATTQAASEIPSEAVTLSGASRFALTSQHTGKTYQVYLSIPSSAKPAAGYPVLYLLDGDFSFPIAHINNPRDSKTLQRMAQHGSHTPDPGVIVGIGYGRDFADTLDLRASDYTIAAACQPCDSLSPEHGGAERFARFLDEELRPEIARRIAINAQRQSLMGHSYGGLFTLHHFLSRRGLPTAFQQYFAISPSLWFGKRALFNELTGKRELALPDAKGRPPTLLALWVGRDEELLRVQPNRQRLVRLQQNRMVSNVTTFVQQLQGQPGLVIDHREIPEHDHGQMHMYALDRVPGLAFTPD